MESITRRPPTEWTASERALMYSFGKIIPVEVSTWGANTTAGFCSWIAVTTLKKLDQRRTEKRKNKITKKESKTESRKKKQRKI